MLARLSPLRMRGGASVAAPESSGLLFGANISLPNYYTHQPLHVNMLHDSDNGGWQELDQSYVNAATGYPLNVPPGGQWRQLIKLNIPQSACDLMRQGTYKARTTEGWTLEFVLHDSPSGWGSLTSGTGVATAVLDTTVGLAGFSIRGTNNTAGNLSVARESFQIYWAAHESLLDSDPLAFDPDTLADFVGRVSHIRAAGLMGCLGPVEGFWNPPDDDTWITGRWTATHVARFAKAIGCGIYYNPPAVMDVIHYDYVASTNRFSLRTIYNVAVDLPSTWTEGTKVWILQHTTVEPDGDIEGARPFFIRNISGQTFQLSATAEGAILEGDNDVNNSTDESWNRFITYEYDYKAVWQQHAADMKAEYPACPYIAGGALNEGSWNTALPYIWNGAFYIGRGYFEAMGTYQPGNQRQQGHAIMSLQVWKYLEDEFGSMVERILEGGPSPFSWSEYNPMDYEDPGVIQAGSTVAELADSIGLAPYILPDTGIVRDYPQYFMADYIAEDAQDWTPSEWYTAMHRGINNLKAAHDQWIIFINARNPALNLNMYEAGISHHVWQTSGVDIQVGNQQEDIQNAFRAYFFGADGEALWQAFHDEIIVTYGYIGINYLNFVGEWRFAPTTTFQQWGIKPAYGAAYDNALWDWLPTMYGPGAA